MRHWHATDLVILRKNRGYISRRLTFLLRHTNRSPPTTGRLGMLPTNAQAPVVPETTVCPDFLQALQVLAQLTLHAVRQHLAILAIHDIPLPIEEPRGDLVSGRILDDGDDAFEFFGCDFASTAPQYISAAAQKGRFEIWRIGENLVLFTACSSPHRLFCRRGWSICARRP